MKWVLYFVIGLTLVGFGTYKYCKFRVDQANAQRYDRIRSSSRLTSPPNTKIITLWQFPLGPIVQSKSRAISGRNPFRESDFPELYKHLRSRLGYFQGLSGDDDNGLNVAFSTDFQGKTKRSVYFCMVGVEVIPLKSGVNPKYKVVDLISGGGFATAELGQPIRLPGQRQIVKRSDFVNPEDIDWMFDVKDFSKINAYATIIP